MSSSSRRPRAGFTHIRLDAAIDEGLAVHGDVRLTLQQRQAPFQFIGQKLVVGVEKRDVLAAGDVHAVIAGGRRGSLKAAHQANIRALEVRESALAMSSVDFSSSTTMISKSVIVCARHEWMALPTACARL